MQQKLQQSMATQVSVGAHAAPQLLVSVQSADEAAMALAAQVDWIDLKDPTAGSLGAPARQVAQAVAHVLRRVRNKSIALGELHELDFSVAGELIGKGDDLRFPFAKVGLAKTAADPRWRGRFAELAAQLLPTRLIPVLYADGSRCQAPEAAIVLELARSTGAPFVLVDTFVKDGRGLLEWLSLEQLEHLIRLTRQADAGLVVAGSLRSTDLPGLLKIRPAAIAVRSAVCQAERTGALSAELVTQWVRAVALPN